MGRTNYSREREYFKWKMSNYNSKMIRSKFQRNLNEHFNHRKIYLGEEGLIKKQNDIAVANSQITLTANRKYLLSYMISGSPTLANTSDPHLQARWAVVSGDNSWDLENVSLSLTECAYDGGHQVRTSISNTSYIIPSETTVIQLECWTQQDASQKSYVLDLNVNIISID